MARRTLYSFFDVMKPLFCLFVCSLPVAAASAANGTERLAFQSDQIILDGTRSSHQLVIARSSGDDLFAFDATRQATFSASREGIVAWDSSGYLTPLQNGETTLTAVLPAPYSHLSASIEVKVGGLDSPAVVTFRNDVVPVFTKLGCNGGGCHGKSGGQNNFRLSLFGYEPWNDHEWLVEESRGRRLSPAAPENSLLLMKAAGEIPHEGGIRLEKNSADFETLAEWIRQGMIDDAEDTPKVERITVYPEERVAPPRVQQQLAVTAYFSDGSSRDITRSAIYEANQETMAEVDESGLVTLKSETGSTSVMVRFQEHVAVFRATIPLGAKVPEMPAPKGIVDREIFSKLRLLGLPPSAPADDAAFLRRVTVDIAGRIPEPAEVAAFLSDTDPEKRSKKIDELLASPDYAAYFAQKWAGILRNKRVKDTYQRGTYAFHDWIRGELHRNTPFDQWVGQLVSASGEIGQNPAVGWYRAVKDTKEQMQDIAQVFLGIRMQCAQCHHHPYEKWSQNDYYGFAAFLSTVGRKKGDQPDEEIIFHRRVTPAMTNPNTKKSLPPTPLGAEPMNLDSSRDPRIALSDWLTSPDNPWFAKMLVNRYWKHFFSVALVEPEDDMRVTNPASHPALLDDLGKDFAARGFDVKHLIRSICNSRAYQLSADPNEYNVADTRNFSRYYPKRLQAEVLLDAINQVAGARDQFTNQPAGVRATWLPDDKFNDDSYFLTVFGRPEMDSACECERVADANLAQSLHLINSKAMQGKLSSESGRAAALAKSPGQTDEEKISELYIHALARNPAQPELDAACDHLKRKREKAASQGDDELTPEKAEREAFEDILWALINTKEFLFNH